jgi:hypothetical protein
MLKDPGHRDCAIPDKIKKNQVRLATIDSGWLLVRSAIGHANTRMTTVRMAVAKFESIFWTQTFARTAVTPAKNAESSVHINQFMSVAPPTVLVPTRETLIKLSAFHNRSS